MKTKINSVFKLIFYKLQYIKIKFGKKNFVSARLTGMIQYENPNKNLHQFKGVVNVMGSGEEALNISINYHSWLVINIHFLN